MRVFETTGVVNPDHTLTVRLPADVPPGVVRVVVEVEDRRAATAEPMLDWEMIDIGPWPEGFTVSREQIYGDDGR